LQNVFRFLDERFGFGVAIFAESLRELLINDIKCRQFALEIEMSFKYGSSASFDFGS